VIPATTKLRATLAALGAAGALASLPLRELPALLASEWARLGLAAKAR
jgi:hypothetical protein